MSTSSKKVDFIKSWYNGECEKLSFRDKLKLARAWTEICVKDEEYEMAAAIKAERMKMVKNHVKEKRRKRSFSQKIALWTYLKKKRVRILLNKLANYC